MTPLRPDQWQELSPYLDEALNLSAEGRTSWLEALRAKNHEIAEQIEELLNAERTIEREAYLENGPVLPMSSGFRAGQVVGPYRLVSVIGQGGMGTVWMAERSDGRFERRAAVKFLSVALAGRGAEERFRREGAILGRLSDPNIAKLLDAGVTESGQPYLVLEHVEGVPIDQYCDKHRLDVRARVRLFLDVLAAVAHAHANLIVHRDIKPPNVLVSEEGEVKLLDFGVAKLLDDEGRGTATLLTREAGSALTPEYAAPEQVVGKDVTTATDVYSLGILLYVLLTSQHPAGPAPHTPAQLFKAIVEAEPRRPSEVVASGTDHGAGPANRRSVLADRLRRQLQGDLDTITLKALKKDPEERYRSVTALADDLKRYLRNEPISVRPDTFVYRVTKFVRRHQSVVALAGIALFAIVAGLIGTLMQARTARAERDFAYRQLARAEAINDLNTFLLSDAAPSGQPFTVNELLDRAEHILEREQNKDNPGRIELLISVGRQYNQTDELTKSRRLLEEAYDLSRKMSGTAIRAKAACALAIPVAFAGERERAETLAQEGLRSAGEDPQFALERIFCLLRAGDVAGARGDGRKRLELVQSALTLFEASSLKSAVEESQMLMEIASAYSSVGRYQDASTAYERALAQLAELGRDDTQTAATLYNNWGITLTLAGQPLESERAFRRAIEISRAGQNEEAVAPMLLVNYARSLRELSRLKEAADYAERGCTRARSAGAQVVLNQCLLLQATIHTDRGEIPRAQAVLAEVEPRLRQGLPAGHVGFGALASNKALLAQAQGELDTALTFSNEAVSVAEALNTAGKAGADYLPVYLTRRASVELALHQFEQAESDARRALSLASGISQSPVSSTKVGRAQLALAQALAAQGKRDQARDAARSAQVELEKVLGPEHPESQQARQLAGTGASRT